MIDESVWLAERFEEKRAHLRAVAYRMLGSAAEADDVVQEAWIRLNRSDATEIDNLGGWLTTVVARICLSQLQSRRYRSEEPLEEAPPVLSPVDPEREILLADSVGAALLVVLETLTPPERLAFVLHDLFAVPFEEVAPIVDRTPAAARQLASRARRRVQGRTAVVEPDQVVQREVVEAFLAAARGGDFEALLALLDPEVVARTDQAGVSREIRGAVAVASGAVSVSAAAGASAYPALVDGKVGFLVAPGGRLLRAIRFTIDGRRIREIEVITDLERLQTLDLTVL
ncbi:RNA polymerase sigma-70 factor (ECF subfamily) [Kribbella orskensis]|uniref:RNA polymerase sigma-70 factor (ECF subfamily) n=1 Tax=Kribbella orskensis TaxID=2512216 RepID=A0ABY2B6N7_9ACTN|nr:MULTISPECIES: sigma-70 family RNA polymerase sigma factor [Kribbella]TCN29210.1 RNA polymerase sigma-70 factor (ECF subfamily) [Kribbella sp. VKM Ac-2500]TCO09459.1 RNA polymerase sigma-70 factor (ECF subfamily) [Kribbella orskensis]